MVQHRLEPLIRPYQGQVNAHNVNDIDRFSESDTRRVTITAVRSAGMGEMDLACASPTMAGLSPATHDGCLSRWLPASSP